jgi:hypothetical protein
VCSGAIGAIGATVQCSLVHSPCERPHNASLCKCESRTHSSVQAGTGQAAAKQCVQQQQAAYRLLWCAWASDCGRSLSNTVDQGVERAVNALLLLDAHGKDVWLACDHQCTCTWRSVNFGYRQANMHSLCDAQRNDLNSCAVLAAAQV